MADPVSIASGVLELLKIARAIITYIKDVKDAPETKKKLQIEVEEVETDLRWIEKQRDAIDEDDPALAAFRESFERLLSRDGNGKWQYGPLLAEVDRVFLGLMSKLAPPKDDGVKQGWIKEQKAKMGQFSKSLKWPFSESEVKEKVQTLERLHSQISRIIQQAHLSLGLKTDDNVTDIKARLMDMQRTNEEKQLTKDFTKIIRWISPSEMYDPSDRDYGDVQIPGDWLLRDDVFQAWIEGSSWRLMIYGKEGYGKTVFSSFLARHLEEEMARDDSVCVLSIFLKYEEQHAQSVKGVLTFLLKQILIQRGAQGLPEDIREAWRQRSITGAHLDQSETLSLLKRELTRMSRVYIIVDGLDEAPRDVQITLLDELNRLRDELGQDNTQVSLLYTSRPGENAPPKRTAKCDRCGRENLSIYFCCSVHEIHGEEFALCRYCVKEDQTCKDLPHNLHEPYSSLDYNLEPPPGVIAEYIQNHLDRAKNLGFDDKNQDVHRIGQYKNLSAVGTTAFGRLLRRQDDSELEKRIVDEIVRRADGSFFLAKAQWDCVYLAESVRMIEDALDDLPTEIEEAYQKDIERMEENNRPKELKRAYKVLMWLSYSRRLLSYAEFQHAFSVILKDFENADYDVTNTKVARRIFDSKDLIDVESFLGTTMGLAHVSKGGVRLRHRTAYAFFQKPEVREKLCIDDGDRQIALTCLAYLSYTPARIPCKGENEEEELVAKNQALPFAKYASQHWGSHASATLEDKQVAKFTLKFLESDANLAAAIQMDSFCQHVYPTKWDIRKGACQVHVAAWFGLHSILDTFIHRSEDADRFDETGYGRTPLIYACRNGNVATVRRLLELKANINLSDNQGFAPIDHAVRYGSAEIVDELCLHGGIDFNALPQGQSCLMTAAANGRSEIIRSLKKAIDLDVNLVDAQGCSALTFASVQESPAVIQALLEFASVNINLQDENGFTALHWSAFKGHAATVHELLRRDADTEIRDAKGITALMYAVMQGHKGVVEEFNNHKKITPGSDISGGGWSLLHGACGRRDNEAIVVWLVESTGADVNAQDNEGMTPLHFASRFGHDGLVKVLLNHNANKNIKDNKGLTPAALALDEGLMETANLIEPTPHGEASKYDIDSLSTPVLAKRGFVDALKRRLTESQDSIMETDNQGDTPLHQAICAGHEECVKLILESGKGKNVVDLPDRYGRSPLHIACEQGRANLVKLLVDHDPVPDLDSRDHVGDTPLGAALQRQDSESAVALIGAGAAINIRGTIDHNVLTTAIGVGNEAAVRRLINHGLENTYVDRDLANEVGDQDIINLLNRHRTFGPGQTNKIDLAEYESDEESELPKVPTEPIGEKQVLHSSSSNTAQATDMQDDDEELARRLQDSDLQVPPQTPTTARHTSKPMFRMREDPIAESA